MNALARRRYSKSAPVLLVLILLAILTAVGFAANGSPAEASTASADDIAEGQKLFAANCATCHGMDAQGTEGVAPSLIGVGAAAVDFQVGTGRMPAQQSGPQVQEKPVQFDDEEISQLAAYVASLGEGPAIPTAEMVDPSLGDPAVGMEIFRTNCAMCHGSVGGGGALTQGKFAPNLWSTSNTHIYEAMLVGPRSMPVFNDANITPENKRNIIAYLDFQKQGSPGGLKLGSIGPVAEGFWGWLVALGLIIGSTVYVGARAS
jgi:ubiquinol-cytochrome c reductase cytochrome c subunit